MSIAITEAGIDKTTPSSKIEAKQGGLFAKILTPFPSRKIAQKKNNHAEAEKAKATETSNAIDAIEDIDDNAFGIGHNQPTTTPITLAQLANAGLILESRAETKRNIEEFRLAQYRILNLISNHQEKNAAILLVTHINKESPFVAINIAGALARWGKKRVVLVDATPDGVMTKAVWAKETYNVGLINILTGEDASAAIKKTNVPNLEFIPSGFVVDNGEDENDESIDLLSLEHERTTSLMNLSATLPGAIVVVYAPPILTHSETASMAKLADAVILVVRANHTTKFEIEASLDILDECEKVGVIMDGVEFSGRGIFGNKPKKKRFGFW